MCGPNHSVGSVSVVKEQCRMTVWKKPDAVPFAWVWSHGIARLPLRASPLKMSVVGEYELACDVYLLSSTAAHLLPLVLGHHRRHGSDSLSRCFFDRRVVD